MKTTKKELQEKVNRLESQLQEYRNERKNMFNKYSFIRSLEEEIKAEIENGNITTEDEIREYIDRDIDNACIYYHTCFEIAMELNATDFTGYEFGEITNISTLAYAALYEYVYEELNISELEELINERANA